jgi:hypothetical protein
METDNTTGIELNRNLAINEIKRMRDGAEFDMDKLFYSLPLKMQNKLRKSYLRYWTAANDRASLLFVRAKKYVDIRMIELKERHHD